MDKNRLNKLKASSVIGVELHRVQQVAGVRTLGKLNSMMSSDTHPLHHLQVFPQSAFSHRLIQWRTECGRMSFLPTAIRLFNASEQKC